MKNIIKGFLLSVAAITLFAGCAQENFSAPEGKSMIFTATIADATRTSIDANGTVGKVNWVAGDEILINGVAYVATPDASDATKATFEKKNASDADAQDIYGEYYATYCCTFDPEMGEGTIPATQVCTSANMISAPMVAVSESTSLSFLNICGLLEINLKGTQTVSSIEVSADNIGLSGLYTVLDGQSATIIDDNKGSVTLDCGDGIALTSEGTKFYVAVPAAEYTGLKVSVRTDDCSTWSRTAVNTASVEANKIYPLEFTPEFLGSTARYTNDGGTSWEAAANLAEAINAINGNSKTNCIVELLNDDQLDGALPDISGKAFVINGNGKTWDISARTKEFVTDASTDVTFIDIVVDGKASDNGFRFIYNYGKVTFAEGAEIKNITFHNPSTGACGVIYNYIGANLDINGAYIHDCKSVTSGTCSGGFIANYGGHIDMEAGTVERLKCEGSGTVRGAFFYSTYMTDAAKSIGTATITGGTFKDCEAPYGGLIYSYAGTTSVENATISGCSATGGGALFVYSYNTAQPSTVTLKNCTFVECSASDYAGAINVSASSAKVTVEGCTFTGCSATNIGSSLYTSAGTLNVSRCTFENAGKDVAYAGNGGTITLTDCDVNYTGTNYAFRTVGTSSGNKAGKIAIIGSRVKSANNGLYATYGTLNFEDSELVCNGSYGAYVLTGGKYTFTDALIVNNKATGSVFFSGTGNTSSNLTVNSGYFYCAGNMTGWYTTGTNNRLFINGGYYSNNAFNAGTQYGTGVTVKEIAPVKKAIGGTEYEFPYQATK